MIDFRASVAYVRDNILCTTYWERLGTVRRLRAEVWDGEKILGMNPHESRTTGPPKTSPGPGAKHNTVPSWAAPDFQ